MVATPKERVENFTNELAARTLELQHNINFCLMPLDCSKLSSAEKHLTAANAKRLSLF